MEFNVQLKNMLDKNLKILKIKIHSTKLSRYYVLVFDPKLLLASVAQVSDLAAGLVFNIAMQRERYICVCNFRCRYGY